MSDMSHLCSVEAEQALLGAFFVKPALIGEFSQLIAAEDFSEPMHGRIFAAMQRLAAENRAMTPVTLGPLFQHEEPIGNLTVVQYFGRLLSSSAGVLNAAEYARIVREYAARRALFMAAAAAQHLAGDMTRAVSEAAAEAISHMDVIISASGYERQTRLMAGEAAEKFAAELEGGTGLPPVPTGLIDLDDAIGGLWRGDYHILAGRPSMGKTLAGGSFALNAAKAGRGVLFLSLEMRTEAIIARMISDMLWNSTTPIPYRDMLRHKANPKRPVLHEQQIWRINEAVGRFQALPLVIDDRSGLSAGDIAARTRREIANFEERGLSLELVVIDHKDFIRASSRYAGNKVAETAEISAALKDTFKKLNVAGLLLCQLSRDVEKRVNRRPDLADLKWAGELEADADMVLFPYREAYYLESSRMDDPQDEEDRQKALVRTAHNFEIIIGKQRNGARMTIDLWADMANNAIRNKVN